MIIAYSASSKCQSAADVTDAKENGVLSENASYVTKHLITMLEYCHIQGICPLWLHLAIACVIVKHTYRDHVLFAHQ